MSHKSIILSIVLLLVASFASLSFVERREMDPDYRKDWWLLAFKDPHGQDADFTIENHGNAVRFSYEVFADQEKILDGSADIPKGSSRTVAVDRDTRDQKITVTVRTSEKDRREIYKNAE
jgi:hypothetical protein